jgi:surface polysaccharide O-acyltransferase-like enzyme
VDQIGTAILGAVLALGADYLPGIGATPAFFLERLGWIILLASATRFVMDPLLQKKRPWFGWLYLAGRESLVVYVVHLALIHAVPWPGGSLERTIGPTQPTLNVALLFAGLLSASLLCAVLNERRKSRAERSSQPA